MKNEQGQALVIALLAITLVVILGTSLMSSTLTSRKQINQSELKVQAIDLAEMGVDHYVVAIETAINKDGDPLSNINEIQFKPNYFLYENPSVQYIIEPDLCKKIKEDEIVCEFTSIGKAHEHEHKVNGTIGIKRLPPSPEIPTPPRIEDDDNGDNSSYEMKDSIIIDKTHVDETIAKSLYVKNKIDIKNHSSLSVDGHLIIKGDLILDTKSDITVKNDAAFHGQTINLDTHANILINENAFFFNQPSFSMKNNSSITINKNAYFYGPEPYLIEGKHFKEKICVKGKVYRLEDETWIEWDENHNPKRAMLFDSNCYNSNPTHPDNEKNKYKIDIDVDYYQ